MLQANSAPHYNINNLLPCLKKAILSPAKKGGNAVKVARIETETVIAIVTAKVVRTTKVKEIKTAKDKAKKVLIMGIALTKVKRNQATASKVGNQVVALADANPNQSH